MTLDPTAGFDTRKAELSDVDDIAEIHVDSWRKAYTGIIPQGVLDGLSVTSRAERLREYLSNTSLGTHTYVVSNLDTVVGFATIGPARDLDAEPGFNELYAIYLRADSWGSGAGRELLRVTLEEHPSPTTWLWVLQANERAQRFYRRNGFQADGTERIHQFGETGLVEVRLARTE